MASTLCCEVSLNTEECEFPAALEDPEGPVRTRCFACGQRACRTCSKVQTYHGFGKRRLCNDCKGEYQGDLALPGKTGADFAATRAPAHQTT